MLLASQHLAFGQSQKVRFCVNPFYNHQFNQNDIKLRENVSRNIYGIGARAEVPISKSNKRWKFSSGIYYYYLHSSNSENVQSVPEICERLTMLEFNHFIQVNSDFKSHNIRVPIQFIYTINRIGIEGGFLLDYEIKNTYSLERKIDSEVICDVKPEYSSLVDGEYYTGELENNKFSTGIELGISYDFKIDEKCEIISGLYCNLIFDNENFYTNSDWYIQYRYAIGVGCKVYF